jgi:Protein of unknown function (DUF3352)
MTDQDPTQRYAPPAPDSLPAAGVAAAGPPPAPGTPSVPPSAPFPAFEPVPTAPVVPIAPARPGRSRLKWLVAIVVSLLVVGAVVGATLMLTASSGDPAVLAWAPADSIVYAEARLDLPGDQRAQLAKTMTALPGFDDQAAFPAKLNEALDMLVGRVSSGTMTYQADIQPWFGGQVGVSMGPIPATADASAARGLVLVSVTDGAKAGAWASKVLAVAGATTAAETYNGVTINTITPPPNDVAVTGVQAAWATFGPVMALGDTTSVKAAIDTKGTAGLPTVEQFKTAEASVPGDRLAFAYVDTAAVLKGAESVAGSAASPMPSLPAFVGNLQVPWAALALRAQDGAFVIDASTPHQAALGPAKTAESKLPSLLPPTTVALIEGQDVGQTLERVKALLAADPSLADGVKQVDDALALVGGFGAVADWLGETGVAITVDGGTVAGGIVAVPIDAAAPGRLFTQLRGFLQLAGGSSGITVTEEPYNGATIVVVDLGDLGSLAGQATGGAVNAPANIKIAYAVTDQVVVIGYGTGFVKAVLDARTGPSLAKTDRFAAALKKADAVNAALLWLDVAGVRTFAETQVPAADKAAYQTTVKPYLDAFDSVIGTYAPGVTLDGATLVIGMTAH